MYGTTPFCVCPFSVCSLLVLVHSSYDQGIITQSLLPVASAEFSVDLNMTDDVAD